MINVKGITPIILFCLLLNIFIYAQPAQSPKTFCNPLNLNYMFMDETVDAREAADPVIVLFKDDYYLFASHSGGYWTSPDLRNWTLIIPTGLNITNYAPAVVAMRDSLFLITSEGVQQVYKTGDPKSGKWISKPIPKGYQDPALFLDDDGRLYMYHGLSQDNPIIYGVELNPNTFQEIGSQQVLFAGSGLYSIHGWERRGDGLVFQTDMRPWIEGAWMNKENGKYYLKYSAPGTEWKTYSDGVYVADSPLGPFQYASYSPVDFKPTGFVSGGGHGATFKDKDGNYWHVGTLTISVKHIFERRLALYPVGFDADGNIHTTTAFGDYPQYFPGVKANPVDENFAGMMLLSHKKFVQASSSLRGYGVEKAVDEDIRTYWSALTGNADEWLMIDLGKECSVEAIQVNFAEQNTDPSIVRGRNNVLYHQYIIEKSLDGMAWDVLVDKSQNMQDLPHDYIELAQASQARYIKLKNVSLAPGMGFFAVQDLRIFGNTDQAVFAPATNVTIERDAADGRDAVIRWSPVADADGYIIRYGIAPDKLYNNFMVYDVDSVFIRSLNHGVDYYFGVEAFDGGTDSYIPTDEFKSFKSGSWNDPDTWQRFSGTDWVHPAPDAPSISDAQITISPGHVITVTAADTVDQVKVDSGATLIVNPGINLKVTDGIGTDLMIEGTLRNKGIIEVDPSSTLSIVGEGIYIHDQDGGSIPNAEWRTGSTCQFEGVTSTAPSNANQDFYNVVWNCPGQTSNLNLGWNGNTIGGNITIENTGTSSMYMCGPAAGSSATVIINGDIIQTGGTFSTNGTGNGNTSITINQNGNINVSGGNFSISLGSQDGTGTTVWNINGDFSMSNATAQNSNPDGAKFLFTGAEEHNLLLGEGNTLTAVPIEVDSGAALSMGTSELKGSGIFILNAGAALLSGHPDGIDGNLKNTGTRTLSSQAGYGFNGAAAQVSGSLLPDQVENLIMDNSNGVTLSKSVTVNGIMEIKSEGFSKGSFQLTYGQNAALKYSGSSALNTSDVEFPENGGPENVIIANSSSSGVTLHAARTISGNLHLSGKFRLADYNFTTASADIDDFRSYVYTNGIGSLTILNVGAAETLFPIGLATYAPVWITNNGIVDDISARVESDTKSLPDGGRVRAKWILGEGTAGGGDYTLKFGWLSQLEDLKFRQDRSANAGIFLLASDTAEAGTGSYAAQFDTLPYTVSRSGITTLGAFGVGKFGDITVSVAKSLVNLPKEYRLTQSYPNPFNPATRIDYSVPESGYITLKVYNVLGEEVKTLFEGFRQQGNYTAIFDASGLSSGMYFYRMTARQTEGGQEKNFSDTKKAILLK